MVEYYTTTELTYPSDRLVALSGVIKAIEQNTSLNDVAGTWKEFWPFDLLWYDVKPTVKKAKGSEDMNWINWFQLAPTWSWAATETPKTFHFREKFTISGRDFAAEFTKHGVRLNLNLSLYTWKCQIDIFGSYPNRIGRHASNTAKGSRGQTTVRWLTTLKLRTYVRPVSGSPKVDIFWDFHSAPQSSLPHIYLLLLT